MIQRQEHEGRLQRSKCHLPFGQNHLPGCEGSWLYSSVLQLIVIGRLHLVGCHHHLKRLSLAPYYAAQMKCCMQKWDRRDNQGANSEVINVCRQLVGIVGTGVYHSMADVQLMVRSNCGSDFGIH